LISILARPIITLIFSSDFSESVILLWILLPTSIIYSLNATLGGVLAAIEKLKINVIVNGVMSIVTIGVSLVLVIYASTLGAAIALGIFYIISTITNLVILFRFKAI
jgi:O-antigen/teichoic acid export membrane protein